MSDVKNTMEPKKDCFAYSDKLGGRPTCKALNGLYCTVENCKFYKPGKWEDIVKGEKEV